MNFSKYLHILSCYFKANKIVANYTDVKAKRNRVNLWELDLQRHYGSSQYGRYNLGDYLARVVVEFMLQKRGLSLDSHVKGIKHLNSIGSNLLLSFQDATVWGSGIERRDPAYKRINLLHSRPFRKLDVRAVRGPLTRDFLMELGHFTPPIYGDPAILMPMIYNPKVEKQFDFMIIPQYYTESDIRNGEYDKLLISMMTSDYMSVINKIKSCKKIISSSLHGIILAESYGVPAVFFRGLNKSIDFH